MKISENTPVSMPMKNLISIVSACLVGAWFAFTVVERLNVIETEQKLMMSDLESANEFIVGVPKGNMVSPQIQELFMLVEFVSKNQDKLKTDVEAELPEIKALKLQVAFLEERLKKAEEIIDKLRNNGTH
jgi:peptidoglycan hydrolase CwlO-like protein